MPNSKQAEKRVRQNETRCRENRVLRSSMRTAVKKVLKAETPEEAAKHLPEAMKRVDKAAKRGVLHDNAAAHKKSQLSRAAAPK